MTIAGLFVVCVLFYWKLALTDEYVWFNHPDMCYLELPRLQHQAREFHQGRFPLWDPTLWMGQPHIGQTQPGPLYPLNVLFCLLPLKDGYIDFRLFNWYYVFIHFLAAVCAYALCRDLRRSRAASAIAAIAFSLAGFIGTVAWLDVVNGAVWTPAICLFFLRAARGRRPVLNAALCGAVLAGAWLSGHHEIPALVSYALAAGWAYSLWRTGRRNLGPAVITFAIAGLIAAVQLWPTAEFARLSERWIGMDRSFGWKDKIPYAAPTVYSLPPKALIGTVLQDGGNYADSALFVGVVVMALAAYAVCTSWRLPPVRWMTALAAAGIVYALGAFTPVHGLVFLHVPILDKARVPVRAIHLFHFAISVLAAYGFDAIARNARSEWRPRFVYVLSGLAAVVFTALILRTNAPAGLVTCGIAALGLAVAMRVRPRRSALLAATGALIIFEVYPIATATYSGRHDPSGQQHVKALTANRDLVDFLRHEPNPRRLVVNDTDVPANFGGWNGFDVMEGYGAGATSNLLRVGRHTKAVQDLFGVTHYVGRKADRPEQIEVATGQSGVKVFRSPDALPRVWSVHRVEHVRTAAELDSRIPAPGFNARTTALLLNGADPRLESCDGDTLELLARGTNRIRVKADMKCRGLVVLSENFYPGWRATVNGKPAEVIETYGALRGVVMERGEQVLDMRFQPLSIYGGAALTLAGLLAVAAVGVAEALRSRRLSAYAKRRHLRTVAHE